ncbi:hypothetical protein VPH35_051600 [Triticum aestivum]
MRERHDEMDLEHLPQIISSSELTITTPLSSLLRASARCCSRSPVTRSAGVTGHAVAGALLLVRALDRQRLSSPRDRSQDRVPRVQSRGDPGSCGRRRSAMAIATATEPALVRLLGS